MARPSWVLIVGILMVFISGCGGIFSDLKQIKTEALIEFSNEIAEEISSEMDTVSLSNEEKEIFKKLSSDSLQIDTLTSESFGQLFKENFRMSDSAQQTFVRHGYIGLVFSGLFFLFGLLMIFSKKPYVIKGTFILLGLSLLFVVYQIVDIQNEDMSSLLKLGQRFNLISGAIMDLLLLLICGVSNKEYFQPFKINEDYYD